MDKPKKYLKRPIPIEAPQLTWENWDAMFEFADVGWLKKGKPEGCFLKEDGVGVYDNEAEIPAGVAKVLGLHAPDPHGLTLAKEGDYVVKDARVTFIPALRKYLN